VHVWWGEARPAKSNAVLQCTGLIDVYPSSAVRRAKQSTVASCEHGMGRLMDGRRLYTGNLTL